MIEGFAKIQEISIRKYMPTLRKENDQNDSLPLSEEITVRTKLVLRRKLVVSHNGFVKSTNIIDIKLILSDDNTQTSFYISTTPELNHEEGRESSNETNTSFYFDAELIIYLPKSDLQLFLNNLNSDMYINTSFYLKDSLNSQGEVIAEKSINFYEVSSFESSYLIGRKHVHWYAEGLRQKVESHLDNLLIKRRGQISQIINEISESATESKIVNDDYDVELNSIKELMIDLRVALRAEKLDSSDSNLWYRGNDDFKNAIQTFTETEQDSLIEKYDTLWRPIDISAVIKWGEDKYGAAASGYDPKGEELEYVVSRLIKLNTLRSRTLENILVNSLIYTETILFARTILSEETFLGVSIPTQMIKGTKNDDNYSDIFKNLAKACWQISLYFLYEVIKIAITFAIALFITSENHTAAWVITTGYTIFRWWRQVFTLSLTPKNESRVLLNEMVHLYQLTKNDDYNPRLIREQLVEVTKKGAVFSPHLFSLIDFQIESENKRISKTP
jgi:hypothetical protein